MDISFWWFLTRKNYISNKILIHNKTIRPVQWVPFFKGLNLFGWVAVYGFKRVLTDSPKPLPYHVPSTSSHDVLFHPATGPVWKFAGRNFLDVASPSISDIQRTQVKKRPKKSITIRSPKPVRDGTIKGRPFIGPNLYFMDILSKYQNYLIHKYHCYIYIFEQYNKYLSRLS